MNFEAGLMNSDSQQDQARLQKGAKKPKNAFSYNKQLKYH